MSWVSLSRGAGARVRWWGRTSWRGRWWGRSLGGTGETMAVAPWMAMTRTSSPGPTVVVVPAASRADQVSPPSLMRPSLSVTDCSTRACRPTRPEAPIWWSTSPSRNCRLISGPHREEQQDRHPDGDDDLHGEGGAEPGGHRGGQRTPGEHDEDEVDGRRLDGGEDQCRPRSRTARRCRSASPSPDPLSVVSHHIDVCPVRAVPTAPNERERHIGPPGPRARAGGRRWPRGSRRSG